MACQMRCEKVDADIVVYEEGSFVVLNDEVKHEELGLETRDFGGGHVRSLSLKG